jgi:hypothetical protein
LKNNNRSTASNKGNITACGVPKKESGRIHYIKSKTATMIRQLLKCNTINNNIATKRCLSNVATARMVLNTNKFLNHQLVLSSTPSQLLNLPSQQQQHQRHSTTPRLSFSTAVATTNTDDEPLLGVGKYKTSTGLVCDEKMDMK